MSEFKAINLPNLTYKPDSDVFVLKNVILSYPHLFEAWAKNDGETKKFSGTFLAENDTHAKEIDALKAHLLERMKAKWKAKIPADKLCFRDGELTGKPEYEERWYLAASESEKPQTVDNRKREISKEDDKLYAGAKVNVMFKLWEQDNKFGKRVNANLLAVQFVEHGERFGAERPKVDDHFDSFGDDEDELGFDD